MSIFQCWHEFKGPVQEDGFQYCKKCGKASVPDRPVVAECFHTFDGTIHEDGYQYCQVCGQAILPDPVPLPEVPEPTPCEHEFDQPIQEDGYQYCKFCGEAILPEQPEPEPVEECQHEFDTKVEDGYQYCKKCGVGIKPAKSADPNECQHVWYDKEKINIINSNKPGETPEGFLWILVCRKCGEMKKFSTKGA